MKTEELSRIGALCVNNKGVMCSDHTKCKGVALTQRRSRDAGAFT